MRRRRIARTFRPVRARRFSPPRNPLSLPHRVPASVSSPGQISRLATGHRTSGEQPGARFRLRLSVSILVVVALFVTLLVRLWTLQIVQGRDLAKLATVTATRSVVVEPPRGDIVTREGQVLAGDVETKVVTLSRDSEVAHPAVIGRLSALLGIGAKTIKADLKSTQYLPFQPVPIASGVSPETVVTISANPKEFPGVNVTNEYERTYPMGSLAAQTIGYLGQIDSTQLAALEKDGYQAGDQIGQQGLEAEYELQLHGVPGAEVLKVGSLGNVVGETTTKSPVAGSKLVLNMSLGVEQTLTNALANGVASLHSQGEPAPWAAGVVLNAENGAVLGIASYPSYNDNWWVNGISTAHYDELKNEAGYPLDNYALTGLQPPGSTFKLTTATAALDDGLITAYDTIDDSDGCFVYYGQSFCDTAESGGAGWLNVSQALTQSNDIFFYELGARFWDAQQTYGVTPIQNVAEKYGLGAVSGIDLPNVSVGQLDSPKLRNEEMRADPQLYPHTGVNSDVYEPGSNVQMAFGQGQTLVTPLEVAEAYATFANGGTRYAPRMAAALVSPSGAVERIHTKVMDKIHYAPGAYAAMLSGFAGAVQSVQGTAYDAFVGFDFNKWNVYGKTGTASVSANDVIPPTAWFVAFGGPKSGPPKYVVAVEVNEAGYGADAAAPIARQVFNYLASHGTGKLELSSSPAK